MNWADKIPGLDPEDVERAADIQKRKEDLNREAAALKDSIVSRISHLVDEEVKLYREIAHKKRWASALYPPAIALMDYSTLCRLLEGTPVTAESLAARHASKKVS